MIKRELPLVAVLGLALASSSVQAAPAIPSKSGWSGHINIGVGAGKSETNMVDGIFSIDLGQEKVSSLRDSPSDEDIAMPSVNFEVAYTLGDSLTQFYVGNQIAEYLSFDPVTTLETHGGIRQQIDDFGTIQVSLLVALPTDVWKDPYIVDARRGDTERTSTGTRIVWSNILGTALELDLSAKEIELDDEESGEALGLGREDQRLLRRSGNVNRIGLNYQWKLNDRHQLVPGIAYLDYELDGDAMKQDGATLQLRHIYSLDRWRLVSRIIYEDLEADTKNPIFDDTLEMETLGAAVTAFFAEPFGWKQWTANATISYHDNDSSIDFYDSSLGMVSVGMLYRFD